MKSFNEINERERSLIELKQQWRTMKMEAKKSNSDYKKSLKATGGGMKPPSPDPQTVEIMEMLPQEFEEDINMFDSDTIAQENSKADVHLKITKDVLIEIKDQNTPTEESCPIVEILPLESTPISLKRCTRNTLEGLQSSKRRKCRIETENIMDRNTAVVKLMQAEHDLKMKQMAEAHAWIYEEHKLKCENLKLKNLFLLKQISQLN